MHLHRDNEEVYLMCIHERSLLEVIFVNHQTVAVVILFDQIILSYSQMDARNEKKCYFF